MNGNDPFCKGSKLTSCFNKKDGSVFSDDFGFGGFIEIDSGFGFLRDHIYIYENNFINILQKST